MKNPFLPLLMFVVVCSCTFEPEGENVVPISEIPTAKVTSIDLMSAADTFQLFARTTNLSFLIGTEDVDTMWVELYIDDSGKKTYNNTKGSFTINVSDYEEGYHKIRLNVITNSGTGSFSDVLGGELLLWSREWTFLLNYEPVEPLDIIGTYAEDGRLMIEWEEGAVLSEKEISIYSEGESWSYNISDPHLTSWIDSSYIGGKIRISLKNISLDSEDYSPITSYETEFPIPTIKDFSSDEFGNIRLSWDIPLFFNNIRHVEFQYNDEVRYKSSYPNDTVTVLDSIPFEAFDVTIEMRTVSRHSESYYPHSTATYNKVYIGLRRGFRFVDFVHAPLKNENGFVFGSNLTGVAYKDSIIRQVPEINRKFRNDYSITADGSYVYFCDDYNISRINREGVVEDVISSQEIFGEQKWFKTMSIDRDRYLCFTHSTYTENFYMYDLLERKMVFDIPIPLFYNSTFYTEQTDDGKYLAIQRNGTLLLTLENEEIEDSVSFPASNEFFLDEEGNRLIMIDVEGKEVEVYDLVTKSSISHIIEDISGINKYPFSYDPVTGYIGGRTGDFYYIFNPLNGEVKRRIFVGDTYDEYGLYDGNLYCSFKKLDLKLN